MGVTFQNILLQLFKTLSVITKLHKNKLLSELWSVEMYSTPSAPTVAREGVDPIVDLSPLYLLITPSEPGVLLPCRMWCVAGMVTERKYSQKNFIRIVSKFISKIKYQANFWKFLVEFFEVYICIEVVSGFSPGPWHPSGPRLWAGSSSPRSPHCSACSYQTWQLQTEKNERLSILCPFISVMEKSWKVLYVWH